MNDSSSVTKFALDRSFPSEAKYLASHPELLSQVEEWVRTTQDARPAAGWSGTSSYKPLKLSRSRARYLLWVVRIQNPDLADFIKADKVEVGGRKVEGVMSFEKLASAHDEAIKGIILNVYLAKAERNHNEVDVDMSIAKAGQRSAWNAFVKRYPDLGEQYLSLAKVARSIRHEAAATLRTEETVSFSDFDMACLTLGLTAPQGDFDKVAFQETVKKAYRSMVRLTHPDLVPGHVEDYQAVVKANGIVQAYLAA